MLYAERYSFLATGEIKTCPHHGINFMNMGKTNKKRQEHSCQCSVATQVHLSLLFAGCELWLGNVVMEECVH